MTPFKVKSLNRDTTDWEIANKAGSVRFMSFEAAIQMFREKHGLMSLKEAPDGYRVTEQGIEMVYKER